MCSLHRIAIVVASALGGAAYVWAEPVADYSKPIPKGVPAGAQIRLTADQPSYHLGENVLLHYEVKNSGDEPLVVTWGGDNRGSPRNTRVRVIATDEAGRVIEDPTPDPPNFGGFGGRESIEPGGTFIISVPVMRYCLSISRASTQSAWHMIWAGAKANGTTSLKMMPAGRAH